MVKKGKLKLALDAHKGVDYEAQRQKSKHKKRQVEQRQKRKREAIEADESDGESDSEPWGGVSLDESKVADFLDVQLSGGLEGAVQEKFGDSTLTHANGTNSEDDEEGEEEQDDEAERSDEDVESVSHIAFSDLESLPSSEASDIVPYQRLTINNTTALQAALKSLRPATLLPFSIRQTVTSTTPVTVDDTNDDLSRELTFYKQSLSAAIEGRARLRKEGVPFTRPGDFFAEMVKNDEHMEKVKGKIADETARGLASKEARKQRDLKKFGKQVQVAKGQERDKAKRDTLEKIQILKRKRKSGDISAPREEAMFDVALEDVTKGERQERNGGRGGRRDQTVDSRAKRARKDDKYGFGGKKRHAKSGDALSTGDLSGFSARKMKTTAFKGKKRLGKSKRIKSNL